MHTTRLFCRRLIWESATKPLPHPPRDNRALLASIVTTVSRFFLCIFSPHTFDILHSGYCPLDQLYNKNEHQPMIERKSDSSSLTNSRFLNPDYHLSIYVRVWGQNVSYPVSERLFGKMKKTQNNTIPVGAQYKNNIFWPFISSTLCRTDCPCWPQLISQSFLHGFAVFLSFLYRIGQIDMFIFREKGIRRPFEGGLLQAIKVA